MLSLIEGLFLLTFLGLLLFVVVSIARMITFHRPPHKPTLQELEEEIRRQELERELNLRLAKSTEELTTGIEHIFEEAHKSARKERE